MIKILFDWISLGLTNNLHLIYTFGRPDRNSIKNKEIDQINRTGVFIL